MDWWMWALTVWAMLASIAVVVLSAKLSWRIELREQEPVDLDRLRSALRAG